MSLEKYLNMKGIKFFKKNDIYEISADSNSLNQIKILSSTPDLFNNFIKKFISSNPEETETLLLPYLAWLRHNEKFKKSSYKELLKLAFDSIVSYNI